MYKIIALIFVVAAFLYACWLVIFRRNLPDVEGKRGFKKRIIQATIVFVAFLVNLGVADILNPLDPPVTMVYCYEASTIMDLPNDNKLKIMESLSIVWLTLNNERVERFDEIVDIAVRGKHVRPKTARMLKRAYMELAYHKEMISKKVMCYEPAMYSVPFGSVRESMQKQINLLHKLEKNSKLDAGTLNVAKAALARDIEFFFARDKLEAQRTDDSGAVIADEKRYEMQTELSDEYTAKKFKGSRDAIDTAELILMLEELAPVDVTPETVAVEMEELEGVIQKSCYLRVITPSDGSAEKFDDLREELLETQLNNGTIDIDTAKPDFSKKRKEAKE